MSPIELISCFIICFYGCLECFRCPDGVPSMVSLFPDLWLWDTFWGHHFKGLGHLRKSSAPRKPMFHIVNLAWGHRGHLYEDKTLYIFAAFFFLWDRSRESASQVGGASCLTMEKPHPDKRPGSVEEAFRSAFGVGKIPGVAPPATVGRHVLAGHASPVLRHGQAGGKLRRNKLAGAAALRANDSEPNPSREFFLEDVDQTDDGHIPYLC